MCLIKNEAMYYVFMEIYNQRFSEERWFLISRIIETKMTLSQMRRVGELTSIFGFRIYLHVHSGKKYHTIILN